MNQANPAQPETGGLNLTPSDIYFIIFRHKAKILLFILLGLVSGATVYKQWPETFISSAQPLVRYVTEKRDVVDSEQDTRVTSAGGRGSEYILQTEIAILNSLDLAEDVAKSVGPEMLVPEPPENSNAPLATIAAGVVAGGIETEARSNVITVTFTHSDPTIPQPVLKSVIDTYIEKHVRIHRSAGGTFDDYLTQQTVQLKSKLNQAENELLNAPKKAGVMDIAEAKTTLSTEMARIQRTILEAEVELAENLTSIDEIQSTGSSGNSNVEPNPNADAEDSTFEIDTELADAVEEYENTRTALEILRSRERELLLSYTGVNRLVKGVREQIQDSENILTQIEEHFPEVNQPRIG